MPNYQWQQMCPHIMVNLDSAGAVYCSYCKTIVYEKSVGAVLIESADRDWQKIKDANYADSVEQRHDLAMWAMAYAERLLNLSR